VNLPGSLVAIVDRIVQDELFTCVSRDEFVRQAVSMLALGIMEARAGLRPFARAQDGVSKVMEGRAAQSLPAKPPAGGIASEKSDQE
jgi:Arc/MetJ-type ribon-helix-helix transcriptional regulator